MKIKRKLMVFYIFLMMFLIPGSISHLLTAEKHSNSEILNGNPEDKVLFSSPKTQASNPREAHALLVGVEDYPGSSMDLQYTMDDVVDISNFLQSEFDIPSQNIQILSDSAATESNILYTISNYADVVDANDYFLFYYSGHGTASITDPLSYPHSISSPHPYSNDYDRYWYINHPGAAAIRVHFTQIETEYNYDAVFVGDGYMTEYCYDIFTGSYLNEWSSWVMTDNIYIELYSDYSLTYWGFAIDKYEIISYIEPYGLYPYSSEDIMLTGNELKEVLDDVGGTQICMFDSCHSGGVGNDLAGSNRLVLCASEATEYSMEDPDLQNGIFTYKFIESWNSSSDANLDGIISFEEAFDESYSKVVSFSDQVGYTYHPQIFDGVSGEVSFSPSIEFDSISYDQVNQQILCSGIYTGLGTFEMELTSYDFETQTYEQISIDNLQMNSQFQFTDIIIDIDSIISTSVTDYVLLTWTVEYNDEFDSDISSVPLSSTMKISDIAAGIPADFPDFDSDGIPDVLEAVMMYDPSLNDSDNDGTVDGDEDIDNDGLSNILELEYGSNVFLSDTDGDGVSDGTEVEKKTNPCSKLSNPSNRLISWVGILACLVSIASIYWNKKGKYIHQQKQEKQKLLLEAEKINLALISIPRSSNASYLKSQIKRLQRVYALENPSLLFDSEILRNISRLNQYNQVPLESCRGSKWMWHKSHFIHNSDIFSQNDHLIVMAALFANTITHELQLFHKHHLPFSLFNLRSMIGLSKENMEYSHEIESISDKSKYFDILSQKPDFIYSSLLETGKNLDDYPEFAKKIEGYWSENKFLSLYGLVYSHNHNKGINYTHLKVLAWCAQLSLNHEFFREILPEKYGNFDTLGELIQKVTEENPTISKEYLDHFQETLSQRIKFQQTKDSKSMMEYICKNLALDPLVLQDWLDLGSICEQMKDKEKAKLCYRVAIAINPYSPEVWGSLLPPKPKLVMYVPDWLKPGANNMNIARVIYQAFITRVQYYRNLSQQQALLRTMQDVSLFFINQLPSFDTNITKAMLTKFMTQYSGLVVQKIPEMIVYVETRGRGPNYNKVWQGESWQEVPRKNSPSNRKTGFTSSNPQSIEKTQFSFKTISEEELRRKYNQLKQGGNQKYDLINKLTSWAQKATSARGESITYPQIFHKIRSFVNKQ
ncbi:MAG: caspase family protein [Promethearchaeota archaeon]